MMHTVKIAHSVKRPRLVLLLVAVAGFGFAGCNYEGGDPRKEIGANPPLPALQQYLIPPIRIARVVGWEKETPTVPQGLQIMHWPLASRIHGRSTSSQTETCWWLRAMVQKRRSTAQRT